MTHKNPLDDFPEDKLTRDQEDALAKSKRPEDKETLVLHNMREAVIYARYCCGDGITDGELISVCYDVLTRGAQRFKPGWSRFFAFCKPGVRGYVKRSWRQKDVVKNGETVAIDSRDPRKGERDVCDDGKIWDDEDQVTPEHEITEPEFDAIRMRERWEHVKGTMDKVCTEQERAVLTLAYTNGYNFAEIARLLGDITRSAVQRTHRVALRKIRWELLEQKRLLND